MNRITVFLSAIFMIVNIWVDATTQKSIDELTQIECSFKKIKRGSKHQEKYIHKREQESSSSNWSGFVAIPRQAIRSPVQQVSGHWTVPSLIATSDDSYSSIWVGIDGYSNGTIEQIGTEQDWLSGEQQNYAWFEMYPAGSFLISGFPVDIGDVISAEVKYIANSIFRLSINNHTQGVSTVIPSNYTRNRNAKRTSAEWIVEAPFDNGILHLADFMTATFTNCSTTMSGSKGSIINVHWNKDQITMKENSVIKALPSSLSGNGTVFHVTWESE